MFSFLCPDCPPGFTPLPLQCILHTETRVILLKQKEVVSLVSKPSDDWQCHLPQSQSIYGIHTIWTASYLSDLLLISPSLRISCISLFIFPYSMWYPALEPLGLPFPQPGMFFPRYLLCLPPYFLWALTHHLSEASLTTLSTLITSCCPSLLLFPPWHFALSNILFVLLFYLFIACLSYQNVSKLHESRDFVLSIANSPVPRVMPGSS